MAHRLSDPPSDFSWLRPTFRPSVEEVTAYAEVIAVAEGHPEQAGDSGLRSEVELQLWIWHAETRTRSPRIGRRPARRRLALVP